MLTASDWRSALQSAAERILSQAGHHAPPVDAVQAARALELMVALDRTQTGRGRIARIAGRSTIFLRPDDRPERLQWAAAHELGETQIGSICRALGLSGDDLSPREREDLANQFAKELLLPAQWFRRDCAGTNFDLTKLKSRYRTASHELIAWRWLDLDRPGIVTIFDQGRLSRRRSNAPVRFPLSAVELACWTTLRRQRQPARTHDRRLTVRGWCIDTPGWEREILYAVWNSEPAEDD